MAKQLEATESAVVFDCKVLPSNVTNGSVDSCANITARQLEFFVVARRGRVLHRRAIVSDRFGGVGAWRVIKEVSRLC